MYKNKISACYRIINLVNKKIYIGSSTHIKSRWNGHKNLLRNNKHSNKYFQSSWNKYGKESFLFEIILYCSPENCIFFEQKLLNVYKPYLRDNGYNLRAKAETNCGLILSEEHKAKISKSLKGKYIGELNSNFR